MSFNAVAKSSDHRLPNRHVHRSCYLLHELLIILEDVIKMIIVQCVVNRGEGFCNNGFGNELLLVFTGFKFVISCQRF